MVRLHILIMRELISFLQRGANVAASYPDTAVSNDYDKFFLYTITPGSFGPDQAEVLCMHRVKNPILSPSLFHPVSPSLSFSLSLSLSLSLAYTFLLSRFISLHRPSCQSVGPFSISLSLYFSTIACCSTCLALSHHNPCWSPLTLDLCPPCQPWTNQQ